MNLQCRVDLASKYKSGSQIARVLSAEWCKRELYCRACDSDRLTASQPNQPAVDSARVKRLAELPPSLRGWTLDVLRAIRRLGKSDFSLEELYGFESELKSLHPQNQNVRPKIRQQLQVLRDLCLISFLSPGNYRVRT